MQRSGSQTICVANEEDEERMNEEFKKEQTTILRLKAPEKEKKHVHWDENALDNEHSGKKKSKGNLYRNSFIEFVFL